MGTRSIEFAEHEFYHIYNRGTDKRVLFQEDRDYQRFLNLLYLSNATESINVRNILRDSKELYGFDRGEQLVHIGAYCLMPNHFHLLLSPREPDGISRFMKKLGTAYSMYFNKKYERTGTLFEGRYKAKWADSDAYLKYLYAYIHLNPLKLSGSLTRDTDSDLSFLRNYRYSSLCDYLNSEGGSRLERKILNPETFPEYFATSAAHLDELREWLSSDSDLA